jgi:hypothetical protein
VEQDRRARLVLGRWAFPAIGGAIVLTSLVVFFLGVLVGEKLEEAKYGASDRPLLPIRADKLGDDDHGQADEISFYDVLDPRHNATSVQAGKREPSQTGDLDAAAGTPNPVQAGTELWTVQVNAFDEKKAADDLAKKLKEKGLDAYVMEVNVRGQTWFRVRAGRFDSQEKAKQLENRIKTQEKFLKAFATRAS